MTQNYYYSDEIVVHVKKRRKSNKQCVITTTFPHLWYGKHYFIRVLSGVVNDFFSGKQHYMVQVGAFKSHFLPIYRFYKYHDGKKCGEAASNCSYV